MAKPGCFAALAARIWQCPAKYAKVRAFGEEAVVGCESLEFREIDRHRWCRSW